MEPASPFPGLNRVNNLVVGFESDYHLIDTIATATLVTPRKAYPVTLLFEAVKNLGASRSDTDGAGPGPAPTPDC